MGVDRFARRPSKGVAMRRGVRAVVLGLAALVGVVLGPGGAIEASASSGGLTASAPGVTPKTITIGFITSETGVASSTFTDSALGAQVRIDAQNAAGGVDGRKLKLIVVDDQSSPTADDTAGQALLSEGVFGIINFSPFAFGGAQTLEQAGVPVTGGAFDGPEWGEQPYTNMFSYGGGLDPHDPASTIDGLFLKSLGAKRIGGIAYGVSPSSTNSVKDLKESVQAVGLTMPYEDLSFPFGSSDTTVEVLQMKQTGVDAAVCSCVQSTNISLIVGAEQAGLRLKAEFSFSGADSSLFANATDVQAAQGAYFPTTIVPLDLNTPADRQFVANLKKYDQSYKGGYPSYGLTGSYLSADLMIRGLELAGRNPTRSSFISKLRKVSHYTAGGLLPNPANYTNFGHLNPTGCMYVTKVEGTKFVTIHNKKPYCGKLIPHSNVA
jgi:branched-chain amino acid transport system substrate-binding protein